MLKDLKSAVLIFLVLSVITGVLYPLGVTVFSQAFLSEKANGSIWSYKGKALGSGLIGQPFDDPKYFWGRLSATGPFPYNAATSSGSNYGPMNSALIDAVTVRVKALRTADASNTSPIPVDLVTSSGSGLDPHISPAAAYYQAARVARIRGVADQRVRELIKKNIEDRFAGLIGEPTVNVLKLNLALDYGRKYSDIDLGSN